METTIEVAEQSQVAEVRRVVTELGGRNAMPQADIARAALVATETTTNLVKYGKHGMVAVRWFTEDQASGIQITAADFGPGFVNFLASARDGHSTGGSLGIGLGAVMRAADFFDVYSIEKAGSAFLIRIAVGGKSPPRKPSRFILGSRSMPKLGQTISGDAWAVRDTGRWFFACMVDGLGHGPLAANASNEAVRLFLGATHLDSPASILERMHPALKSTRGAVVSIVAIDTQAAVLRFAGVGNIAAAVLGEERTQHLLPLEGTVGYGVRSIREAEYPWNARYTLVMNTDGLVSRWTLAKSPGLLNRHPELIAAVLHRDFARNTDDATVLVLKET